MDRIKELETELERLKKLTPKELVDKLSAKEKEINDLRVEFGYTVHHIEMYGKIFLINIFL